MEELFDEVNVGEDHSAAAVALKVEFGESLAFGAPVKEERKVGVPFVADHLATREAADGNDLNRAHSRMRCRSDTEVSTPYLVASGSNELMP